MQYVVVRSVCGKLAVAALFAISLITFPGNAVAQINLAWNPSSDSNVVGYHVYFGPATRSYTNSIDVLNATNCTVSNLVIGTTYYFAATAYDSYGVESDLSAEVFATTGASNTAPFISSLTNVAVAAGSTTPALPFSVWDAQTPAVSLTVSGVSDNQALVKNASIAISGTSTNRSVKITASSGQTGVANITLSVSDGSATSATAFQVNVRNKPLPPGRIRPSKG